MEAVIIWPTLVFYGHPEDSLALAFALYGLLAAFDGAWVRIGIFFALAILFQPLTLLIVPIALAYVPRRRWPSLGAIIVLPSALALLPPLRPGVGSDVLRVDQTTELPSRKSRHPLVLFGARAAAGAHRTARTLQIQDAAQRSSEAGTREREDLSGSGRIGPDREGTS
jgi:hypothetical protein